MDSYQIAKNTEIVKGIARSLNFMYCGVSKADFLEEEAPRLTEWLKRGNHGKMHYMENHFDKRLDPRKLVPGAQTVVSLLYNYYAEDVQPEGAPKISRYAYGKDYHFVVKDKLKQFFSEIQEQIGDVEGRIFVDSAPVMDKAWAKRSGLGWVGKNTNLIHPKEGSFFFIAELIIDLPLEPDGPIKDYCGTCTRCIDACPTDALQPYEIDAKKCISYMTIELKDEILPKASEGQMENWMFGCDICQDVCPWNRFAQQHQEPAFRPHPQLKTMDKSDWKELTREVFNEIFRKSAVKRTKYSGLMRNIRHLDK
ncbi:MAG: tRNA epoxyqueuosine(34) reductase QueG [Bacteroidota bacterium]